LIKKKFVKGGAVAAAGKGEPGCGTTGINIQDHFTQTRTIGGPWCHVRTDGKFIGGVKNKIPFGEKASRQECDWISRQGRKRRPKRVDAFFKGTKPHACGKKKTRQLCVKRSQNQKVASDWGRKTVG